MRCGGGTLTQRDHIQHSSADLSQKHTGRGRRHSLQQAHSVLSLTESLNVPTTLGCSQGAEGK